MEATTGASRGELLEWINTTLKLNIQKIEETASGNQRYYDYLINLI